MEKSLILMVGALFLISVAGQAQNQKNVSDKEGTKKEMRQNAPQRMSAESRAEYWAKELNLTNEEKAKITELFKKQDEARMQQRADMQKSREERQAFMESQRKANDAEMEKIIGKEKFQKYDSIRTARMEKMRDRMRNR
jgi:Spy/CpxP family protein refolding chaperone